MHVYIYIYIYMYACIYIYIYIYTKSTEANLESGGWKCAIAVVPWRGISFSMLSLG